MRRVFLACILVFSAVFVLNLRELRPAALSNFVCMQNASFFATRAAVTDTWEAQTYRIDVKPPPGRVIWRSTLVIAYFTCEGNSAT